MHTVHDAAIERAQAASRSGDIRGFDAALRAALGAWPESGRANAMLGIALSGRESLVPGEWHLRRALESGDRQPQLLAALAHNLLRQGQVEEAEALLTEATGALGDTPEAVVPLIHLAAALERLDRIDEAMRVLDRAKRLAGPGRQDILLQEAALLARTPAWRDALVMLDTAPALGGSALLARGRLRDRAGRYDEAWRDFIAGKRAITQETGLAYNRQGVQAHLGQLGRFFTPSRMAALPRAKKRTDVPNPIFIIGFPRSGTTMTEQLITSHPRIRAGGELPFTGELVEFAANQLGAFPDGLAGLAAADRHHLVMLFRDFYLARAETYGLLEPGADAFTDKMPLNDTYLPLLHLAFPEARIVSVRRHPLDVLVSIMSHGLTHGFNSGFALDDAALHMASAAALVDQWEKAGIGMHRFGYERFVGDQAGETARLMAYLGLEADPAQADFHRNARHAPTPSYAQIREPVYDRSVGRWHHYREALAPARDTLRETIAREGYDR